MQGAVRKGPLEGFCLLAAEAPRCGCVTQGRGGTFLQNEAGHRACAPTPTGLVSTGPSQASSQVHAVSACMSEHRDQFARPTPAPVDLGVPGEAPSLVARPQRLMSIRLGSERTVGRQGTAPMLVNRAPSRENSDASRVSLVTGPCAERSVAVNSAYVSCRPCQLGHNAQFSSQGGPHNVIAPHDQ